MEAINENAFITSAVSCCFKFQLHVSISTRDVTCQIEQNLSENGLKREGVRKVCEAMMRNKTLQSLDLSGKFGTLKKQKSEREAEIVFTFA